MFDPVLFDVTRIPADDIATQITRDDFEVFQNIRPDEVRLRFLYFVSEDYFVLQFLSQLDINLESCPSHGGNINGPRKTHKPGSKHLCLDANFSFDEALIYLRVILSANFVPRIDPVSMGCDAFQCAAFVLYESPVFTVNPFLSSS